MENGMQRRVVVGGALFFEHWTELLGATAILRFKALWEVLGDNRIRSMYSAFAYPGARRVGNRPHEALKPRFWA